jgi:glycosyltransferase involved in cell wall biosynthesis
VIHHREPSGAETSQAPVVAADPAALVACPTGSASERLARSWGAETVDLPFRSLRHSGGVAEAMLSIFRGVGGALELRRILRRHPDRGTIYGIGARASLMATIAAAGTGRRVVWTVTDLLPPPPLRGAVRALAWLGANRAICLSSFIAEDLAGRSRRLRRTAVVIHPGVDPSVLLPPAGPERGARQLPGEADQGEATAALVGQVSSLKQTELAIAITRRVLESRPGFRLLVIGGPQFREEDFALERRLKREVSADPLLDSGIRFLGHRQDVPELLAGCDLLLHCRAEEPFGMVLIEAMALGLAVVAPASGGPLEIVREGETGLLYPAGDVAAATGCILELLRNPARARGLGLAARRSVEQRFTSERQVRETRELLSRPSS